MSPVEEIVLPPPATQPVAPFRIEPVTYPVLAEAIAKLADQYLPLRIAGVDDRDGFTAVHAARMEIKSLRVNVEKRRKELKASALEYGRKVDDAAKKLVDLLSPIEGHLEGEENRIHAEKERLRRAAEEEKRRVTQARVDQLVALGAKIDLVALSEMTEEQFAERLAKETQLTAERDRLAKLEAERLEAERAERQRLEDLEAAERAKLAKQQAEERAEERRRLDAERAELDRQRREQQAEADRIAAEQKAENERLAAERQRIADEQAERDRAAAAERAKAEAEQKAQADRQRAEALRPDREKLECYARDIERVPAPDLSDAASYQRRVTRLAVSRAVEAIRQAAKEMI